MVCKCNKLFIIYNTISIRFIILTVSLMILYYTNIIVILFSTQQDITSCTPKYEVGIRTP